MVSGRMINPYVNLTMDDDFIGNGRIIQFGATSAPDGAECDVATASANQTPKTRSTPPFWESSCGEFDSAQTKNALVLNLAGIF